MGNSNDIDFVSHPLINETKELHEHLLSDKNVVSIESTHTEVLEEGRAPEPICYTKLLPGCGIPIPGGPSGCVIAMGPSGCEVRSATVPPRGGVRSATVPPGCGISSATVPSRGGVRSATVLPGCGISSATVPLGCGVRSVTVPPGCGISSGGPSAFTPIFDLPNLNYFHNISILTMSQNPLDGGGGGGCGGDVTQNFKPTRLRAPRFVLPDLKSSFNCVNNVLGGAQHLYSARDPNVRRSIALNVPDDGSVLPKDKKLKKRRNVTKFRKHAPTKKSTAKSRNTRCASKRKQIVTISNNKMTRWSRNDRFHIYNGPELMVKFEINTGCINCVRKSGDINYGQNMVPYLNSTTDHKTGGLLLRSTSPLDVKTMYDGDKSKEQIKYHQFSIKSTKFGSSIHPRGIKGTLDFFIIKYSHLNFV